MRNWSWIALCALLVNCQRGTQPKPVTTLVGDPNLTAPTLLNTRDLPGDIPNPATASRDALTGSTCKPFMPPSETEGRVKLTRMYAGLAPSNIVAMQQPDNDKTRWFVLEQSGRLSVFPNRDDVTESDRKTALDLTGAVSGQPDAGARGFVLHHNFINNGLAYVAYAAPAPAPAGGGAVNMTLARYTATADGNVFGATAFGILQQPIGATSNLAGSLQLSAAGLLYWSLGSGDTANAPGSAAQDPDSLLGKLLRIDVEETNGNAYGIPPGNAAGGRPEVYLSGLHNAFRFVVDRANNVIIADTRQGSGVGDEINLLPAAGDNLGWPVYQGNTRNPAVPLPSAPPTYFRPDVLGNANICFAGGLVYHGQRVLSLSQSYIFGDCQAGHIWILVGSNQGTIARLLVDAPAGITTFVEDNDGEVYVLTTDGGIYRIDPVPPDSFLPRQLSQTGCTHPNDIKAPPDKTLNYRVRLPFWSDGADKGRTLALPADGTMQIDNTNHVTLPRGTVLVKNFEKLGRRIETRLYMRFLDGTWGGYSYAWNDAQTDATLVQSTGATLPLSDGSEWYFPARDGCAVCHSDAPGFTLGWQVAQLNTPVTFSDGSTGNQLEAFVQEGLLAALPAPPDKLPQLPDPLAANVSLESRARSYLHVNCAACHQPGGLGLGPADFRFDTATKDLGVCNVAPTLGTLDLKNEHLLTPGSAKSSVISARMHATNGSRMPAISSWVVDPAGTAAVDAWINSLRGCP